MSEQSSINQSVAKAFAGILAAVHGVVFFGAFFLLLQYNDRSGAIRRLLDAFEISFSGYATIIGIALIFYILSVGAIATLIAINENLHFIRSDLANRRMTADVAESNAAATNGRNMETPSESLARQEDPAFPSANGTPRVVTDGPDNAMLYLGIVGIFVLVVVAMWMAWE
jgi:hypothetical protein